MTPGLERGGEDGPGQPRIAGVHHDVGALRAASASTAAASDASTAHASNRSSCNPLIARRAPIDVDVGHDDMGEHGGGHGGGCDRTPDSARTHDQDAHQAIVVASMPPAPRRAARTLKSAPIPSNTSVNRRMRLDSALIAGDTPTLSAPKM